MPDRSVADWLTEGDDDLPPELPPGPGTIGHDLEPDEERSGGRLPRRRLWMVAGVAWALVVALGVTALTGPSTDGEPVAAAPGTPGPDGAGAQASSDTGTAVGAAAGEGAAAGAAVGAAAGEGAAVGEGAAAGAARAPAPGVPVAGEARPDAAAAVASAAAMTVRLAETTHDPESGTSRYVDLALPAGVTWLGDLAVVTVDAVVLDGDGEGWGAPRTVRYVQPMRLRAGGVVPAGQAWTVPSGGGAPSPPGTEPADDPSLVESVGAALAGAGYEVTEIRVIARASDRPGLLVATVEARAPGGSPRSVHDVWLTGEDPLRVLGTDTTDHVHPEQEREQGP